MSGLVCVPLYFTPLPPCPLCTSIQYLHHNRSPDPAWYCAPPLQLMLACCAPAYMHPCVHVPHMCALVCAPCDRLHPRGVPLLAYTRHMHAGSLVYFVWMPAAIKLAALTACDMSISMCPRQFINGCHMARPCACHTNMTAELAA